MRRSDREISDRAELDAMLRRENVLHLGLCDGAEPYVVPMNYGYDGTALYLHSALEGRKIEALRANPRVCFTVTAEQQVVPSDVPCGWSVKYRSLIGYGTATLLETAEEKAAGLAALMRQFTDKSFQFPSEALAKTAVIRIEISEMTGKTNE